MNDRHVKLFNLSTKENNYSFVIIVDFAEI